MQKYKEILLITIIIVVALWGMKALLHPGFFTSHDGWHIVARLFHFDQAIRSGQLPPRWSTYLMNDFGYPLFFFSYHLPWWMAEPLVLLGVSLFDALKAVFIITFVGSGLSFYFWAKSLYGKMAAAVGSILYLWASYRFATVLVRANIGEAVSFLFIPLIFLGLSKLKINPDNWGVVILALGLAGCLLSHIMIIFLFAIPICMYFFALLFWTKTKKTFCGYVLFSCILAFGIDLYYLLPAIAYKPLTVFTRSFSSLYRLYPNYFTPFSKLVYSPWGFNAIGLIDEMSRQVGIGIWVSVAAGVVYILFLTVIKRKNLIKNSFTYLVTFTFLLGFLLSLYMMQKISVPVWHFFEPLALVDFPFRFLAVTTFLGATMGSFVISQTRRFTRAAAVLILLVIVFYTNRNYMRVNLYTDIPVSLYVSSELSTNTYDEYLPTWVNRDFAQREHKPLIDTTEIQITNVNQNARTVSFNYTAPIQKQTGIRQMYFPGITVDIDQKRLTSIGHNGNGAVEVNLPNGPHHVSVGFTSTPLTQIGEIVSTTSIIIAVGIIVLPALKKERV